MAIDGILIKSLVKEFKDTLIGGRIQKIYQINNHLIIVNIYNNKENYRLLISSNPQNSRIHFTDQNYDNPIKAPQFSMILRKHLQNSNIIAIRQIGLDRSIEITVEAKDELGLNRHKKLMIDIMGKYSNIVLVDENNKVIEAIKRISHEMSSVRAVYPGTSFNPLLDDKINILEEESSIMDLYIADNMSLKRLFYTNFQGFGPQISNQIIFNADLDLDRKFGTLTESEKSDLDKSFKEYVHKIINSEFIPYIFTDKDKIVEYYCMDLSYLANEKKEFPTVSEALDLYYKLNVNDNSLNQAKENITSSIKDKIEKNVSKLDNLYSDFELSKDYDKYRIEGDLLAGVAYQIQKGQESIDVNNYYTNEMLTISLDNRKSAWDNVELKYKKSKKLHRSHELLKESIPKLKEEIEYLSSIIKQIENAENHSEIEEIREELQDQNFLKKSNKAKKLKEDEASKPLRFEAYSGNIIYVGKNNKQNEYLTLREANPEDYFFHIKDLPGSHVILKNNVDIVEDDIYLAAYLAAKYSKNTMDRYIDVDYTQKKNVNKAKGSKPGMVYYTDFITIRVDLEDVPDKLK